MPKLSYLEIPFEIKAEDISEDGVFSGWGSLFDQEPDAHRDLVARGAFMETLAKGGRNRTGIMMGWQHNMRDIPPGVWLELREDQKGLFVRGQLDLDTQLGKEVYSIMKLGAKTGMWKFSLSIGYDSIEQEYQRVRVGENNIEIEVRLLKKVELWEISIVNFPAKIGATVLDVKNFIKGLESTETERDLEKFLRDSGFSKSGSQHVISMIKKTVLRESKPKGKSPLSEILDSVVHEKKRMEMSLGMLGVLQTLCQLNSDLRGGN